MRKNGWKEKRPKKHWLTITTFCVALGLPCGVPEHMYSLHYQYKLLWKLSELFQIRADPKCLTLRQPEVYGQCLVPFPAIVLHKHALRVMWIFVGSYYLPYALNNLNKSERRPVLDPCFILRECCRLQSLHPSRFHMEIRNFGWIVLNVPSSIMMEAGLCQGKE